YQLSAFILSAAAFDGVAFGAPAQHLAGKVGDIAKPAFTQDDGGSRRLPGREAQAGQVKLAVLGVSQVREVRYHGGGNGPQPSDDFSRFVEPSHMGVAGCEIPMRVGEARILLDRETGLSDWLIETPSEKMRGAYCEEPPADAGARAQPQRRFGMLDRDLGLARIQSED